MFVIFILLNLCYVNAQNCVDLSYQPFLNITNLTCITQSSFIPNYIICMNQGTNDINDSISWNCTSYPNYNIQIYQPNCKSCYSHYNTPYYYYNDSCEIKYKINNYTNIYFSSQNNNNTDDNIFSSSDKIAAFTVGMILCSLFVCAGFILFCAGCNRY